MDYNNTEVSLSMKLQGCIAARGKYTFNQTGYSWTKINGTMEKTPVGSIRTTPTKYSNCFKSTILNSSFVNWAISNEARPKKQMSARHWNNLSKKNRLIYQIGEYVKATHGDVEFSFEVIN